MSDMGTPEHSQPPDPHDLVRGWYKEYRTSKITKYWKQP